MFLTYTTVRYCLWSFVTTVKQSNILRKQFFSEVSFTEIALIKVKNFRIFLRHVYSFIHFQEVICSNQVDISRHSQEMERNEPEISEAHKIDVLGTEMVTT